MIRIKDLTVKYPDGHIAINKINVNISKETSVAVVGENGAGKSSLLLSLAGVLPPISGEILIDEIPVNKNNLPSIRKLVGLIFQNPDDQLFMTSVYDDIAFGPRNMGLSEWEVDIKVKGILEQFNISHLIKRIPGKLSGGEKRSVAIAGVLTMSPSVLLFDEPTSFLDPKAVRQLVHTLNSLPLTKLIATHDLSFARKVCNYVILMQNGSIVAEGPTNEILDNEILLKNCGL